MLPIAGFILLYSAQVAAGSLRGPPLPFDGSISGHDFASKYDSSTSRPDSLASTVDCLPLGRFAQRTGQESCWVKFYLSDHRTICVDHRNWIRWLLSPASTRICLGKVQTWRAYSPLINNARASGSLPGGDKVTVFRRNYVVSREFTAKKSALKKINPRGAPSRESNHRGGHPKESNHKETPVLQTLIQKIESIRERTSAQVARFDDFGILRSLLVNEKTSQSPVSLLRKLGFVHLASATGIHLYALARGWDSLLRWGFFYLRLPAPIGIWSSRILSFGLCFCVWILSGARVGMLRPWIVLSLKEISTLMGFRWRRASPLLLALGLDFGIALFRAWIEHEPFGPSGRMIYALAVGGGLIWCRSFKSVHIGLAIGSWLLVAIWEAWHSGSVALFTPILSLISLPLACFCVFPIMMGSVFAGELGFVGISETIDRELSWGFSILTSWLTRFAFSFGNVWVLGQAALLGAFFLASLICAFQVYRPWKAKTNLVIIGMLLTLRSLIELTPRDVQVEQLDVGQGDAALIRDKQGHWNHSGAGMSGAGMIDAGSQHALTDEGWLQLLATRQITRLNWAAISHLDEDHSGGFLRLARLIHIDCIAAPPAEQESLRGGKYDLSLASFNLKLESYHSGCIPYPSYSTPYSPLYSPPYFPPYSPSYPPPHPPPHPPPSHSLSHFSRRKNPGPRRANENMGAIYVPLKAGGFYLSAGDATQKDEILIGNWASQFTQLSTKAKPKDKPKRILKVSHHGSKTSSAPEFLRVVRPTEVWISAGRGNRYGHPAPLVLERLETLEVPIKRTDRDGVLPSF